MLALFILIFIFCFGICQWAAGRYDQVLKGGLKERAPTPHTAEEIVKLFLAYEGVSDVEIVEHSGYVSNYFDPKRRRLFLQPQIARSTSMGAWAVALHEAGHVVQMEESLSELRWRQTVISLNRYGPMFGLLGLAAMLFMRLPARYAIGAWVAACVILLLLNLGTLALENNANARLRRFLDKHLDRQEDAHERLRGYLSRVATREVGDLLRSPSYFFLSGLPGGGKIRPVK
jgi:Zn-dependent membrane protease YugP